MAAIDRYQILEDEPASRLPVCMLIDCSYSMRVVSGGRRTGKTINRDGKRYQIVEGGSKSRMEHLLSGFHRFVNDINNDIRARASVEMAIVSFGDTVNIERDFEPIDRSLNRFYMDAAGDGTCLGAAVKTALELLDRRKNDYDEYSISSYHPQLVILTDGYATDPDICAQQGPIVQERMKRNKLICLPFLIGDEKNVKTLQRFCYNGETFRIEGANLSALFEYLSRSAIQVSRSTAGGDEAISMDKIIEELKKSIIPASDIK